MLGRIGSALPPRLRRRVAPLYRAMRRRPDAGAGEGVAIARLLGELGIDKGVAVDVAACDGVTKSNTLTLYERGWRGLAVEGDPVRFADLAHTYRRLPQVALERVWVTPENIGNILRAARIPREFAFLNLDLDSYDHFVLAALLEEFRPQLVCAEINEKIPPPLRFTVSFDPEHRWRGDHFYGQSIVALHELAERHDYALVELHYNNAFLVPRERGLAGKTPEDAFREGYADRPDRAQRFPWNADMEPLVLMDVDAQLAFVRKAFAQYEGRYELSARTASASDT